MKKIGLINTGGILPALIEPMLETEIERRFGLNSSDSSKVFYTVKSNGTILFEKEFTGIFNGAIIFRNGEAKVRTLYEKRMCIMRGCYDATPPEDLERLRNRDLKRILVIRNAAFGDVLIVTPFLKALKNKYPNAIIHFFGKPDTSVVMQNNPYVDAIIAPRETELGYLINSYDEVFDLVHSIEHNGHADFENALDVLFEDLGFISEKDLPISDRTPIYNVTKAEFEAGAKILKRFGIDINKDKYVYFQGEGTAIARSLHPFTSLLVMNYLISLGFKVVYATHRPEARNFYLLRSQSNKNSFSSVSKTKVTEEDIKKGCFSHPNESGALETWDIIDFGKNVFYTQEIIAETPPRDSFAMMANASFVVSVDSFYSHLAAALDKFSVVIFTNYYPYSRTKYYDKTIAVHPDYENKVPCGPCNSLINDCPLFPGKLPLCSESIDVKDIFEAIDAVNKKVIPIHQKARDSSIVDLSLDSISCNICGSKDHEIHSSKGSAVYFKCHDCESLFSKDSSPRENKKLLAQVKKSPHYAYYHGQDVTYHLGAISQFLKLEKVDSCSWVLFDPYQDAPSSCSLDSFKSLNSKVPKNKSILCINVIERLINPYSALLTLSNKIQKDSYLCFVSPLAETLDPNPANLHLLQPIAGLNKNILSLESLKRYFDQTKGTHRDKLILSGMIPCPQGGLVILKKV